MKPHTALILACLLATSFDASSQATGEQPHQATTLAAVIVSGTQPGPQLWKVTKQGHTMWILPTLSPLPEEVTWHSEEVERVIQSAQEVLLSPSSQLSVGRLKRLSMLSRALGDTKNPQGRTLADLLPADVHRRWVALNDRYGDDTAKLERYRPFFVAHNLYVHALKRSGLSNKDQIHASVSNMAKRAGVSVTDPTLEYTVDDPKAYMADTMAQQDAGIACLGEVMHVVEDDLSLLAERADAWSTGNLETLEALPSPHAMDTCHAEFQNPAILAKHGVGDLASRTRQAWLDAAKLALTNNLTTFSLMPLEILSGPGGYAEALRAAGYEVAQPDEKIAGNR